MNWTHKGIEVEELPDGCVGFVYILTAPDGVMYVGKKIATANKYKIVNGKRKKIKGSSNWQKYYGSSEDFLERIKDKKELVKREILHYCDSKSEMAYLEAKEQIERNVLMSDDYDNRWIMLRVTKAHLKKTREKKNEG